MPGNINNANLFITGRGDDIPRHHIQSLCDLLLNCSSYTFPWVQNGISLFNFGSEYFSKKDEEIQAATQKEKVKGALKMGKRQSLHRVGLKREQNVLQYYTNVQLKRSCLESLSNNPFCKVFFSCPEWLKTRYLRVLKLYVTVNICSLDGSS